MFFENVLLYGVFSLYGFYMKRETIPDSSKGLCVNKSWKTLEFCLLIVKTQGSGKEEHVQLMGPSPRVIPQLFLLNIQTHPSTPTSIHAWKDWKDHRTRNRKQAWWYLKTKTVFCNKKIFPKLPHPPSSVILPLSFFSDCFSYWHNILYHLILIFMI